MTYFDSLSEFSDDVNFGSDQNKEVASSSRGNSSHPK